MNPTGRSAQIEALLVRLGFARAEVDLDLINQSLTHRSWATENGNLPDNERLEFLGDAVIGLITAEYLFDQRPDDDEGRLSKLRATLISRRILGTIARDMGLGELVLFGVGERGSNGAENLGTLGSALEALLGALYLSVPSERLRENVRRHIVEPALALADEEVVADYKSRLQEWAQGRGMELPTYQLLDERGPDHDREFEVEVSLGGKLLARGVGRRKKWAENEAARKALSSLPGESGKL